MAPGTEERGSSMSDSIETFLPEININREEPADVRAMDTLIAAKRCTHVRSVLGGVWEIAGPVTARFVPILSTPASVWPIKLCWWQIDAFGRLA